MAKFLAILGSLSGSIGDNTFSHNKGGPYVRKRGTPTNPNSTKQQAARAILATLSGNWASLTDVQRAGWADYAALSQYVDPLGTSFNLSGQQMFVALNSRLLGAGTTASATAPTGTGPDQYLTLTPTLTAPSTISMAFTATPLGAGERMALWTTLPASAGRDPNFAQARLVGYSAAAAASPASFTTPYPMATGQVVNLFVARVDAAGRTSPAQKVRVVVP